MGLKSYSQRFLLDSSGGGTFFFPDNNDGTKKLSGAIIEMSHVVAEHPREPNASAIPVSGQMTGTPTVVVTLESDETELWNDTLSSSVSTVQKGLYPTWEQTGNAQVAAAEKRLYTISDDRLKVVIANGGAGMIGEFRLCMIEADNPSDTLGDADASQIV